jgi:hypothetical protein
MITYEGKDLRIHHNSDFSGDLHIYNKNTGKDMTLPAEDIFDLIKSKVIQEAQEKFSEIFEK